ncbi:hypothetical protein GP2_103_00010 [Gordonia paraffinivorans NBRC 108238]|uniref:Uncharacterized protein n=1 Tax=Gordonia paraffinivorans NBRC 108238 TaxID=1223543 RepID=A0ABQ0IRZ7_9ACTN|nr:hypothetical protein [Gordonia paraffinivorans]GAC86334.1 hypothetical protein GP2_103_00010 [Gordonia paraffinivorans NBRC 108238]
MTSRINFTHYAAADALAQAAEHWIDAQGLEEGLRIQTAHLSRGDLVLVCGLLAAAIGAGLEDPASLRAARAALTERANRDT